MLSADAKLCPNCGGNIVNEHCQGSCRAIFENPDEVALRASRGEGPSVNLAAVLWNNAIPAAEPPDVFAVNRIADHLMPPAQGPLELGLGGGLVTMPDVQPVDRQAQIDHDLRLPLAKRVCSNPSCQDPHAAVDSKTGRRPRAKLCYRWTGDDAQLPPDCRLEIVDGVKHVVPERGYCRFCCTQFDLLPLAGGTTIGPIRVEGPFACGGDAFIHHATHTISGEELVLKTPHNKHDPAGARRIQEEAIELKAWQDIPGVFRLIGVLQHEGRPVMVLGRKDGLSLTDIRLRHKRPLPPEVGFSYLIPLMQMAHAGHRRSRWHLDIQPKNAIVGPDGRLSLGDFGAGQAAGTKRADHGFTPGFSAPEMDPERGKPSPSAAVDAYGFGRLLGFLILNMNMLGRYKYGLPTPDDEPVFAGLESVYRFMLQLTALNPRRRMDLAQAIEQAQALRLEIIALKENRRLPVQCPIFLPDTARVLADDFATLPRLRVDENDVAASAVASVSYGSDLAEQTERLEQILKQHPYSRAARLLLASLLIDGRSWEKAEPLLQKLTEEDPFCLLCLYERGRLVMGQGDLEKARLYFDACYSGWPGTVGVKLALARAEELLGNKERARRLYETAARVDGTRVTGAFGLARLAEEVQDWSQAIQAYGLVPRTSWAFARATSGMINAYLRRLSATADFQLGELEQLACLAGPVLDQPDLVLEAQMLKAEIYKLALTGLRNGLDKNRSTTILGVRLVNRHLRRAAADALREASGHVQDENKRRALITEARRLQPMTVFGRGSKRRR